jgi:pimeloyl-ACP methyl ester carboxylesterase
MPREAPAEPAQLRHRQVTVDGLSIHAVEAGAPGRPAALLLHGWPESWAAFEPVMSTLAREVHVVAIDLPGIGRSVDPAPSNEKRALAGVVRRLIERLGLTRVTLVGHDIGGMIAYAFVRAHAEAIERAVIMNVAVPGVEPWSEIVHNPQVWHFGFHAVRGLPELLVTGRQVDYFAYFYDRLAAEPGAISDAARAAYVLAYSRTGALRTGFEWYRAFPRDEEENAASTGANATPLLYLRGDREPGAPIERYVEGFRRAGLTEVRGRLIRQSGHFALDEQPDQVTAALREFMATGT